MAQIPQTSLDVGYVTRVETDAVSDSFVDMLRGDGIDTANVGRDAVRTMGLYMIELTEAERSFGYWRDASAAQELVHDAAWLDRVFAGAGLIHLSGITLGILDEDHCERLAGSLQKTCNAGACISFDPPVRPKLWASADVARAAMALFLLSLTSLFPASTTKPHCGGMRHQISAICARCRIWNCGLVVAVRPTAAFPMRLRQSHRLRCLFCQQNAWATNEMKSW